MPTKSITAPQAVRYAVIDPAFGGIYFLLPFIPVASHGVFWTKNKPYTVLVPIVMLSLFVFSAALTGMLIFGRPALWYLDGKKKEALSLLAYTLVTFLIITIIALLTLYLTA